MGNVGDGDRGFLLDDPSGRGLARALVALDHVHALHDQAVLGRNDAKNFARSSLVAAGEGDHPVTLLDLQLGTHQSTMTSFVRSEERRVGKEWVRTCSTRWSPSPKNKKKQ